MTKLLMSAQNPEGMKLEDLLDQTIEDLKLKNEELSKKIAAGGSNLSLLEFVHMNNRQIIWRLERAKAIQQDSLDALEHTLGKDQGPSSPRM